MGKDTNWVDSLERRIRLTLHTGGPAKVISFNEDDLTADIELLFLTRYSDGDTEPYPIIEDAPVLFMRYKIRDSYPSIVNGLQGVHGGVDGSNATILPKKEVEYYPFLKKGDRVWVNFAERAIDNMNGTEKFDPDYYRTHDINDAVIVGLI